MDTHCHLREGLEDMNRFFIGILATASLVACVDNASDPKPTPDNTYTVGDRTIKLMEGDSASDQPAGVLAAPNLNAAGCRVVLDWCSEPGTGDAVCHFTNCTIQRALDACDSLIGSTCGF